MTSEGFMRRGAIDLSSLARPAAPPPPAGQAPGGGAGAGGSFVVDVSEENFQQEVVERSVDVPVVIDFWAEWCQPCKQLSPILERLTNEYAGRLVLAKIDIDANQRIAQAAQVQSIPLVVAVIRGQIVPLFQGAIPEAQVRQYFEELLRVAAANGVTGTAQPVSAGEAAEAEAPESEEPQGDPRYAAAEDALNEGDFDGAVKAFEDVLAQTPADTVAKTGLAQAKLLSRIQTLNPEETRAAAAAKPDDAQAQLAAADLDFASGNVDQAFTRLIDTIRLTAGDERNTVRLHLLELFEALGSDDTRVRKARQALSTALF